MADWLMKFWGAKKWLVGRKVIQSFACLLLAWPGRLCLDGRKTLCTRVTLSSSLAEWHNSPDLFYFVCWYNVTVCRGMVHPSVFVSSLLPAFLLDITNRYHWYNGKYLAEVCATAGYFTARSIRLGETYWYLFVTDNLEINIWVPLPSCAMNNVVTEWINESLSA